MFMPFFFFFSSRRRHTRLQGDWSSDVCSSDLDQLARAAVAGEVEDAVAPAGLELAEGELQLLLGVAGEVAELQLVHAGGQLPQRDDAQPALDVAGPERLHHGDVLLGAPGPSPPQRFA